MLRQVLSAVGQPQLIAVDQGLHATQIGERGKHRDIDSVVVLVRQRERDLLHQRDRLEVIEVHLPVAGDEWLAAHDSPPVGWARLSTSMPGSVLPSRYSREAPPPVEMCEKSPSGMPSARTA